MEPKDIKITIPRGYVIDTEKSTFERIVFKKKKVINSWEDIKELSGYTISLKSDIEHWSGLTAIAENKNVFLNKKYTKSAIALAQISQLLPYYDSNVDWGNEDECKFCIFRVNNRITIDTSYCGYELLAFKSIKEAGRFLKYNEQLVKDYFML